MSYREKLDTLADKLEPDSVLILFSAEKKVRNRDVHFEYRNSSDFLYLTGYNVPEMVLCLGSDKSLVVFMNYPDNRQERWSGKMLSPETVQSDLKLDDASVREFKKFWNDITEILKNKKIVYLELNHRFDFFSKLLQIMDDLNKNNRESQNGPDKIYHVHQPIHELRVIKSAMEIQKIRDAIEITGKGFTETMLYTREMCQQKKANDIFEYNIKSRIESVFKNHGAMNLAYPTIVASGNNANYLHYESSHRQVNYGDLILVDAGCEFKGYASDITRTFPCSGKFTTPQREIYEIVLGAQKAAISQCLVGNSFESIHNTAVRHIVDGLWHLGLFKSIIDPEVKSAGKKHKLVKPGSVEEVIEKKYYQVYYMHYTSHYLGLDVHDVGRYFLNGKSRNLEPGMVFTVEPGIYISKEYRFAPECFRGIGIRIEDNIAITPAGCDILSKNIPREINEIENLG